MDRLWSPWRSRYVTEDTGDDVECVFCAALEGEADMGVLHRNERSFVILNAFPYNSGHVMVAPVRHVPDLGDLDEDEAHEIFDETRLTVAVLQEALSPQGFNIGINLGRVAGAGVPGHVHVHVVPRWGGDTNFMPVVGETKVLPESLADT
ncbi:MAG: HIT family protein, partial [Actinomycetota bacterium]